MSDDERPPPGWHRNHGEGCPKEAEGKRVAVILRNGHEPDIHANGVASVHPHGWAADDKGGCRWSLRGLPHDIRFYRVL